MSRNGSGVYSKPSGTTAYPNTLIRSAQFNTTVDDIVTDLNLARPIVAGGTAGTTAEEARNNLGIPEAIADTIPAYISQFPSVTDFTDILTGVGDFWSSGDVVQAGPIALEKRMLSSGSLAWLVGQSDPARIGDAYLGNQEGSVKVWNLAKGDEFTVLGNPDGYAATPQYITMDQLRSILGFEYYGDTADGGIDLPSSASVPDAPTAIRAGRSTSSAGAVTSVVFVETFEGSTPNIVVTPVGTAGQAYTATISARTITGFDVEIFHITAGAVTRVAVAFSYIAIANGV